MKVLDLRCAHGHAFEGWFASEEDFGLQLARSLLQCPICGDGHVTKLLSAPRLHLGVKRTEPIARQDIALPSSGDDALGVAWLALTRHIMENTTDVGERFAEEARKIHYGESAEHNIRGRVSAQEARSLVEEGIEVLPFVLPHAIKGTVQ